MNSEWMDEHYPRCTRCGLRTFVSNFTGRRLDELTDSPSCPAWNEPEAPAYPYVGSEHSVAS